MTTSQAKNPDDTLVRKAARRRVLLISLAGGSILLLAGIVTAIVLLCRTDAPVTNKTPKRNVILMVSDGFGPASETFSRTYYQKLHKLTSEYQMPLDTILVGTSRTQSTDSLVTDSSAAATAFACGVKSFNVAIGVNDDKKPCGTVLEAAKATGMLTGLVATNRITDPTPASFSAHVTHRSLENEIALQQIGENPLGRQVDLMMGGGRCRFMPQSAKGSCRKDDRDLLAEGREKGWNFITSPRELNALDYENPSLPLGALFALDEMAFDIDRKPEVEPSLKEMSAAALSILDSATKSSENGFFLMIEGSRIDLAAHTNDAASHFHDIMAYQDTVSYVKEFVDNHPGTVMISVSDHETGGLTLARQVTAKYPIYRWFPEVVARVKKSAEALTNQIMAYEGGPSQIDNFLKETIIKEGLGIEDPTDDELDLLKTYPDRWQLENRLSEMVNVRAELGWTTHGHSGVDVNLYAYGPDSEKLRGNSENTAIGEFIRQYLSLDLAAITKRLDVPEFLQRLATLDVQAKKEFRGYS